MLFKFKHAKTKTLATGSRHYRAFVGPIEKYDIVAAMQFNLLTSFGLREHHTLLDIGCGSLRAGRLLIPYLLPRHYFGIEPEKWLVNDGIRYEIGKDMVKIKKPQFSIDRDFSFSDFNQDFDYLIAQSIFSHAPESAISNCLREAARVMKPSSLFAATYVKGEMDYNGSTWVYPECVAYTSKHIEQLAREAGLTGMAIRWPHPNQQTWMIIVRQGNEHCVPHELIEQSNR